MLHKRVVGQLQLHSETLLQETQERNTHTQKQETGTQKRDDGEKRVGKGKGTKDVNGIYMLC